MFCREPSEELADLQPRLTITSERKGRAQCGARRPLSRQMNGQPLTMVFRQERLRVERVHLRRPPIGENLNYIFCAGAKVRPTRQ